MPVIADQPAHDLLIPEIKERMTADSPFSSDHQTVLEFEIDILKRNCSDIFDTAKTISFELADVLSALNLFKDLLANNSCRLMKK